MHVLSAVGVGSQLHYGIPYSHLRDRSLAREWWQWPGSFPGFALDEPYGLSIPECPFTVKTKLALGRSYLRAVRASA